MMNYSDTRLPLFLDLINSIRKRADGNFHLRLEMAKATHEFGFDHQFQIIAHLAYAAVERVEAVLDASA